MTDIVKRLRDIAEDWFGVGDGIHEPINQGADEIERLREALSAMTELFKATEASAQLALSEVERLREALREIFELKNDMGLIANDIARAALGEKE